jgi:membrane-associated phospholipid phosphatase
MQNLYIATVGGGLALAAHPADNTVNRHLVDRGAADKFFKPGKYIGQTPTLIGVSLGVYAYGRIKDEPRVSHLGMDLVRAMVVNEALTQGLKYTVRRERPDLSDRHSFPSGHASTTFAIATALERHLGWKGAVPVYVFSSYVATSRLHDNRHYLSDVIFGATVGIISGRTVTRHGSSGYTTDIVPVNRGAMLLVTRTK